MSSIVVKKSEERKVKVDKIIRQRMLYAAGMGLIPFPVIDAAGVLSIQLLMLKDISRVYRTPFTPHVAKALVASLVGGLGTLGAVKLVPGIGTVLGGATVAVSSAAATYAIGKVFATHFDQGGTMLDFDPVATRKYFEELFREGQLETERLQKKEKKNKVWKKGDTVKAATTGGIVTNNEERKKQLDPAAISRIERRELLLDERRKVYRKNQRITNLKKWLKRSVFLILFVPIGYLLFEHFRSKDDLDTSTELDLYIEETLAKKIQLDPVEELDSLMINKVLEFPKNATESVIARYISSPEATYPKRFALSAVRFVNNSVSLSSGGEEQLSNIAFLMKMYPDLTVNLYGHSSSIGPKFSRQKIGRRRARMLKDIFIKNGISAFRLTGNYIEKSDDVHDEYWGAEIVLDVSTKEDNVLVEPPEIIGDAVGQVKGILSWTKSQILPESTDTDVEETEEFPEPEDNNAIEKKTNKIKEDFPEIVESKGKNDLQSRDSYLYSDRSLLSLKESVSNKDVTAHDDINKKFDATEEAPLEKTETEKEEKTETEIEQKPEEENADTEEPKTEEEPKEESEENLFSSGTTEAIMSNYVNSSRAVFPKVFSMSQVRFAGEATDLNAAAKEQIANLAKLMDMHPKMKVNVYALIPGKYSEDNIEKEYYKWMEIGKKRAKNVKKQFGKQGISGARVRIKTRRIGQSVDASMWGMDIEIKNN